MHLHIQEGMSLMASILVIHGPNMNLLGTREPEVYGHETLTNLNYSLIIKGEELGHSVYCFQHNAEHILIDRIHQCLNEQIDFIIINPAAFTHTSIAMRDALLAVNLPFVEVHLTNTQSREPFRHHSYFSDIAIGSLTGLGPIGYTLALQFADHYLTT